MTLPIPVLMHRASYCHFCDEGSEERIQSKDDLMEVLLLQCNSMHHTSCLREVEGSEERAETRDEELEVWGLQQKSAWMHGARCFDFARCIRKSELRASTR